MPSSLLEITDRVADVGIIIGFFAALAFLVSYVGFHNWRMYPAGRALVYFVASLLAVATLSFLGRWIGPEYFGREFLRPAVWLWVAAASIRVTYVLWTSDKPESNFGLGDRKHK